MRWNINFLATFKRSIILTKIRLKPCKPHEIKYQCPSLKKVYAIYIYKYTSIKLLLRDSIA